MRLMKEDVENYVKRMAYRDPTKHEELAYGQILLARNILERMDVPYAKEEDETKNEMAGNEGAVAPLVNDSMVASKKS